MNMEVRCIHKQNHHDPTQRILELGGPGWRDSQQAVIQAIERRTHRFYVRRPEGGVVWLIVAKSRFGNKYVKTEADGESPDNLLSLEEC